jgi:para-nitrobenzyl esterase
MTRIALVLATAILAAAGSASAALPDPIRTDAGLVSGAAGTSADVRVFKGIPFAAPPVGNLRWRAPQPVTAWDGVRKADQFGPRCMQGGGGGGRQGGPPAQPMAEDCLYLNVWSAAAAASERRPVIVWSYGGAFTGGAGSLPQYDGEAMARKGVVFVTYNYRLGPFGFFAHPELTKESGQNASGNYGVMDLVAALTWVQKNIAAFGGDPSRVTLMGESAGGGLTQAVVASPQGKGLFIRAISQSAPVRIERMATLAQAEQAGRDAAAKINAASLADLRSRSADEIQKGMPGGRPMVDGWYLPQDAWTLIMDGRHNDVDVLLGSNKDEGAFPFFGVPSGDAAKFTGQVRQRFGPQADAFLKLYPAGSDAESNASQLAAFRDEVAWNMRNWAAAQATSGRRKAYLFYFTHEPPAPAGQTSRGASHTAEIPYTFNNPSPTWTAADRALADTMSSYWVNFAAKGDPNGSGLPTWPAYVPRTSERHMTFGAKVEAAPALDAGRVAIFDALFARIMGRDVRQTAPAAR